MAYINIAYIVVAYIVMGSTVMAHIGMASTVMAFFFVVAVVYCCTSSELMTNMPTCHDRRAGVADRPNDIVMGSTGMDCTVMACIVMAVETGTPEWRIGLTIDYYYVSPSAEAVGGTWVLAASKANEAEQTIQRTFVSTCV